jgi:hypothetical protein
MKNNKHGSTWKNRKYQTKAGTGMMENIKPRQQLEQWKISNRSSSWNDGKYQMWQHLEEWKISSQSRS